MSETIPRLEKLQISNFQSLEKADIDLGGFTVIIGPSNSGKSALLRALKAVVRNVNSPSAVRVGKNAFTVALAFGDTEVSIERGKSHSTYRMHLDGTEEVYTKAGRAVPDDVQRVLALPSPEGPDLVFSSQIEPPFLLDETGSTAAKIIGDLTNVSRLHAAAKESNRRRLESSKMQKIREDDALGCMSSLKERFSDLPAHSAVIKECRELLDKVRSQARNRDALVAILDHLDVAAAAEADLRTRLGELPEPKDIESLSESAGVLLGSRHALLDALTELAQLTEAEDVLETKMSQASAGEKAADKKYEAALKEHGWCPTCARKFAA